MGGWTGSLLGLKEGVGKTHDGVRLVDQQRRMPRLGCCWRQTVEEDGLLDVTWP